MDALVAAIETAAPPALRRHKAPGAAVAVVFAGEVVWTGGFGLADKERSVPVSAATPFALASVTKPVSAWGVLKLAEEGLVDLDAPIERYLSRWSLPPSEFDHDGVTVRRVLGHAAGLSFGGDPGVEPGDPVPTLEQALDGAGQEGGGLRVAHPPGQAYRYSSKGYMLLELMIEEVTGRRFSEFMRSEILEPLGMEGSSFDWTERLGASAAIGHDWYNRPLPRYGRATHAQGGLISSAEEFALFLAATVEGPQGEPPGRGVITAESVRETFSPVTYAEDASLVGLGYNLSESRGTVLARKTGDNRGWKVLRAHRAGSGGCHCDPDQQ